LLQMLTAEVGPFRPSRRRHIMSEIEGLADSLRTNRQVALWPMLSKKA
jgi:hypothetical protein